MTLAFPKPKKRRKPRRDLSGFARLVLETDGKCMNRHCWDMHKRDIDWLEAHHIILRSQGGKDTIENGITLCRYCHERAHKGYTLTYEDERARIPARLFMLFVLALLKDTDKWRWDEAYKQLIRREK